LNNPERSDGKPNQKLAVLSIQTNTRVYVVRDLELEV
jgi:hypothetical protein